MSLEILPQPDYSSCGPTCLHSIYRYHGQDVTLEQVNSQIPRLDNGGTLAVYMGIHALKSGLDAHMYTYNLDVFDPTWFMRPNLDLREKLRAQMKWKQFPRLHRDTLAYIEFLEMGGRIEFEDLTPVLIRKYLNKGVPILTGLSATYLYNCSREFGPNMEYDDVRGDPTGHFVVLCGYDRQERTVLVADPLLPNPVSKINKYSVDIDRLICSILLGILTYDANLLIIQPKKERSREPHAYPPGRQQPK